MDQKRLIEFLCQRDCRTILGIFLATAIIVFSGVGQAQSQIDPAQKHDVAVTLKLVRVFVTDAAGRPATNLRAEDFRIIDNGVLQKIKAFEVYVDSSTPGQAPPVQPDQESQPAEAVKAPGPMRPTPQKFIFVIDATNNDMQGLSMAHRAAIQFLETKLRPGDEAAVVTMSGMWGIDLVGPLTADLTKVRAALDRVRAVPGRRWLAEVEIRTRSAAGRSEEERAVAVENALMRPSQVFLKWMPRLAAAFSRVGGTKNVILFSAGFHVGPKGGPVGSVAGRLMASSNMPVYAVNTEIAKNSTAVIPGEDDFVEEMNPSGQGTLDQVAALSGGRSFGAMNSIVRFERVAEAIQAAVRNYYVLGYDVRPDWDGKYHQVQVEVLKPGLIPHAQSGYFDSRPSRQK